MVMASHLHGSARGVGGVGGGGCRRDMRARCVPLSRHSLPACPSPPARQGAHPASSRISPTLRKEAAMTVVG